MIKVNKTSDKQYSYANILILGESGVGKTHFLGTVPESEMLIFNVVSESGMATLRGKNIDVIDINNYHDMIDAIEWVKTNGAKYSYIGVDSISQWQKNLESQLAHTDKFKLWKDVKDKTKEVVDSLKALPYHIVCLSEIAIEKDEETGALKYLPSLIGSSRNDFCYWFDEVYYFDRVQDAVGKPITYRCLTAATNKFPCKTRSNLPMIITNPNLEDIINKSYGKLDKTLQSKKLTEFKKPEIIDFSKKEVK